ncbi:MAG: zf-TFIIB domain-containing protein [Candidatus Theseobacter exili]|nr:zf-TFIIB domain-containing protein [Candidatus Theseobacter exili]
MLCPACKKTMLVIEFDNIELDYCTTCEGCWLDEGELSLILHGEMDFTHQEANLFGKTGNRRCPHCRKRMRKGPLPQTDVEVDICPQNHGIWLDKGELNDIIKVRGNSKEIDSLAKYCEEIFRS